MGSYGFGRASMVAGFAACAVVAGLTTSAATATGRLLEDTGGWAIVAGIGEVPSKAGLRFRADVRGGLCADEGFMGAGSSIDGVLVATSSSGTALKIRSAAQVTHDVVTGGADVRALPRTATLPGLPILSVPAGRRIVRRDGSGAYDTTGGDPAVGACVRARESLETASAQIEALTADLTVPSLVLRAGELAMVTVPKPGEVNVIDTHGLRMGTNASLSLDGGGNPDTVLILRVDGRLRTRLGATLDLGGGLQASNVLIYATRGACNVGDRNVGGGSLMCPGGKIALGAGSTWTGTLLGGAGKLELGASALVVGVGFVGL